MGFADATSDRRSRSGRSSNRSSCRKPDMFSNSQRTGRQGIARLGGRQWCASRRQKLRARRSPRTAPPSRRCKSGRRGRRGRVTIRRSLLRPEIKSLARRRRRNAEADGALRQIQPLPGSAGRRRRRQHSSGKGLPAGPGLLDLSGQPVDWTETHGGCARADLDRSLYLQLADVMRGEIGKKRSGELSRANPHWRSASASAASLSRAPSRCWSTRDRSVAVRDSALSSRRRRCAANPRISRV